MKTTLINLYAGPGAGKSTKAAELFYKVKRLGIEAELISEYVKQWVWEERKICTYDQFYIFGKQAKKEYSLFGKVDYIITDAPMLLSVYYTSVFGSPEMARVFSDMYKVYVDMCKESGVEMLHYWVERQGVYQPNGRIHSEEEALAIDKDLQKFLVSHGITTLNSFKPREEI